MYRERRWRGKETHRGGVLPPLRQNPSVPKKPVGHRRVGDVVVIIKSADCPHCVNLSKNIDEIKSKLYGVAPDIRIVVVDLASRRDPIDDRVYPACLSKYKVWVPMILYVPGKSWDDCLSGHAHTFEGEHVMNGKMVDGNIVPRQSYDIRQPGVFSEWLEEVLAARPTF